MHIRLTIICSFIILSVNALAEKSTPTISEVDKLITQAMTQRQIPALALTVIRDGEIEILKAYGHSSIELSTPASTDTVFQIASVTKAFTAVAIQVLATEGKLNLNDSIDLYLDDIPDSWRAVTIKQLLQHTSGLPDIAVDQYTMLTIARSWNEALQLLRNKALEFTPGSQWHYNSTNMLVLDRLINTISEMAYDEFIQRKIFQPLGITSATFGGVSNVVPNRATHYTWFDFSGERPQQAAQLRVLDFSINETAHAGGGLNISIADFSRWLAALLNKEIVDTAHLEALWQPTVFNDGTTYTAPPSSPYTSYGLGWIINSKSNLTWVGGTGGLRSAFAVYPSQNLAIVILTNLQGAGPERIIEGISNLYLVN